MKICILSANLGSFDKVVDPVAQETEHEVVFHRFTDDNFPPITGLTPRFQYRLPKLFGWEMMAGFDLYIWLDGSMSFTRPDCVEWFVAQLGSADAAFFKHPQRQTMREEVEHLEEHLKKGKPYITARYKNGLHKEMLNQAIADKGFADIELYTSTAFIYRGNDRARKMMLDWWHWQSRYYTCDQVALPYAIYQSGAIVRKINVDQYKTPFLSLVSKHS